MQSRRPEENRARSECHVSRNPPPYSWTTLRLRPGLRPPKHPMSAGEPLDTSVEIDVFIRPTQPSALTLLQRVESHPRPAPQEFSLCPKFACWSKGRWPCSFRPPGRRDQASGFQTRGETFLSLSVAPTPTPCSGSEPRMRGAGLAPQLPGRGRRQPAQHVAHVSVPHPTPSARLSPRRGSGVVSAPLFDPGLCSVYHHPAPLSRFPKFPPCAPSQFLISGSVPTSELSTSFRALKNLISGVP